MPYRTGDDDLDARLQEIAAETTDPDLVFEMLVSAVRIGREQVDRGDRKLINTSLKELRYAAQVFAPYHGVRKATIFGSARTRPDDPSYQAAFGLGAAMADRDWMVLTGAGPGIMEAGLRGAGADMSFGINIQLPWEASAADVIADDPKLINFRYFFTRKLTFVKESDGFALLPGGFGTMDEAFELLTLMQTGRTTVTPVVLLEASGSTYWETWFDFVCRELRDPGLISPYDLALVRVFDDVEAAADELVGFYSNYHSMRYVGRRLVLRLTTAPTATELHRLSDHFADIVVRGRIEAIGPTEAEAADGDELDRPRVALEFDRASHGRLRQLLDALNGRPSPRLD